MQHSYFIFLRTDNSSVTTAYQVRPEGHDADLPDRRSAGGGDGSTGRRPQPHHAALSAPLQHHHHQRVRRLGDDDHLPQHPQLAPARQRLRRRVRGLRRADRGGDARAVQGGDQEPPADAVQVALSVQPARLQPRDPRRHVVEDQHGRHDRRPEATLGPRIAAGVLRPVSVRLHLTNKQKDKQTNRLTNRQRDKRTDVRNRIWCILVLNCDIWRQEFYDIPENQLIKFCLFVY